MIRKLRAADAGTAAEIWLDGNLSAHGFIPTRYWHDQLEALRKALPQAEAYVWEEDGVIQGFIGLQENYIAGIFVRREVRSGGIGRHLLERAKEVRSQLTLHVYKKNRRALAFYQREGFRVREESTDEHTGEREYAMIWELS